MTRNIYILVKNDLTICIQSHHCAYSFWSDNITSGNLILGNIFKIWKNPYAWKLFILVLFIIAQNKECSACPSVGTYLSKLKTFPWWNVMWKLNDDFEHCEMIWKNAQVIEKIGNNCTLWPKLYKDAYKKKRWAENIEKCL